MKNKNKKRNFIFYHFNEILGDFEEVYLPDLQLNDLLDDNFILLFVDPQRFRVWLWQGYNTTIHMRYYTTKVALRIRDIYGTDFGITFINQKQDNDTNAFLAMIGLEDHQILKILSLDELLLLIEKAGTPEGFNERIVIVKNRILRWSLIKVENNKNGL